MGSTAFDNKVPVAVKTAARTDAVPTSTEINTGSCAIPKKIVSQLAVPHVILGTAARPLQTVL